MLPILKQLIINEEIWVKLTESNKEQYQYHGCHSSNAGNILYHTPDVTKLPHYSEPHVLWSDIQLSKTSAHQRKCAVHNLVQEGNDNSIVQIK